MSDRTKMLLRLWRASNLAQIALAICAWIWFAAELLGPVTFALLVVSVVGGQALRIAYNRSLRRDRQALAAAEAGNDA